MRDIGHCIVCGGEDFERRFDANFEGDWQAAVPLFLTDRQRAVHGRVVACRNCGFTFTSPQFDPDEYARIYESIPPAADDAAHQRAVMTRFDGLARRMTRYVSAGRFLDLGCGSGAFHLSRTGFEGFGFEVASGAGYDFDAAGRRYSGNFAAFSGEPEQAGRYDFVTAWDVFEHLAEPDSVMQGIGTILKPGGWLLCSLPDISSWVAKLSGRSWNCLLLEHLWYFTPATLEAYLARFGFERREVAPLGFPVDAQTIANRLAQTYGWRPIGLPGWVGKRIFNLPIGLMFAAFQRSADEA